MQPADNISRPQTGIAAAPRVGIGVALHNRASYLREALDSILSQTWSDITVALVDDASSDETESIAREYVRRDPRVRYIRFDTRRGMIASWRAAFEHATAEGPDYFAWGSDHDRWDPRWLEVLVATLDADPDVVLAYPLTRRIDPAGAPLSKLPRHFETVGIHDLRTRWVRFSRSDSVAAGDMVYGLMRADAVRAAGVFREVLCPDRLLLAELTLQGQIRQVPEVLWYRRQFEVGSIARQRQTLFGPGMTIPGRTTAPWQMHVRSLRATYGAPDAPVRIEHRELARLLSIYAVTYAWRHYTKPGVQRGVLAVLGWPRWLYKRIKRGVLLAVYHILVARHRVRGRSR